MVGTMMDVWTFLWLLVCLTILISILESIHRRIKERQMMRQEFELQRHIQAQQYNVYTLQPLAIPLDSSRTNIVPTAQQQLQIQQQQELKACNDLPPKYEDVVKDTVISIPINGTTRSNSVTTTTTTPDRF